MYVNNTDYDWTWGYTGHYGTARIACTVAIYNMKWFMDVNHTMYNVGKMPFCHMLTAMVQISMRIRAV